MTTLAPMLTVISGGADTGKSLIAELLVREKGYAMVARDHVRAALTAPLDEWQITLATFGMARALLQAGVNVCAVGWNLEPADRSGWQDVARDTGAGMRWVHVEAHASECRQEITGEHR